MINIHIYFFILIEKLNKRLLIKLIMEDLNNIINYNFINTYDEAMKTFPTNSNQYKAFNLIIQNFKHMQQLDAYELINKLLFTMYLYKKNPDHHMLLKYLPGCLDDVEERLDFQRLYYLYGIVFRPDS